MLFVFKRSDTISDTNLSYELPEIRTIGRPSPPRPLAISHREWGRGKGDVFRLEFQFVCIG